MNLNPKKIARLPSENSSSEVKSFLDHFSELRKRFLLSSICILVFSFIGYLLSDLILEFLVQPLQKPLYYTSPTGGFYILFKVSILFGVLVSTPFIFYQLIRFIEPALSKKLNKKIIYLSLSSFIFMMLGVMFAYYISLPYALLFLDEFSSANIKSLITTSEYFSFILAYIVGFGILFEIPLIIVIINWIRPLKPSKLIKFFPYLILISFIISAIITPTPDPFNQTIMAGPIIILYFLSVALVWFMNRKKLT